MKKWAVAAAAVLPALMLIMSGCAAKEEQRMSFDGPFALTGDYDWCGCGYSVKFTYYGSESCSLEFLSPESVVGLKTEMSGGVARESYNGIERETVCGSLSPLKALCALFDAAAAGAAAETDEGSESVLRCGGLGELTLSAGVPQTVTVGGGGPVIKVTGFERIAVGEDAADGERTE